jgi:AmmeMemoRadiSam system protein A/AmmeMemoRadiSam system protein B
MMPIRAAFLLPHPPLAIPDVGKQEAQAITDTLASFRMVAEEINELKPETIIVISPHQTLYSNYFHVSPGVGARGSFHHFGAPQVEMTVEYDERLREEIITKASRQSLPTGVLGERDPQLDHGTMVPLYFVNQCFRGYKIIRFGVSGLPLAQHYMLGTIIREAIESLQKRVVVIASGDLSHRLSDSGPYGYAPQGPAYDQRIIEILASADFGSLLKMDEHMLEDAGECGHRSIVMMSGLFDGIDVKAHVLSYEGPLGVGYAVAAFHPGTPNSERHFLEAYHRELHLSQSKKNLQMDPYCRLAQKSLEHYVHTGKKLPMPDPLPNTMLNQRAGVFVSLKIGGNLRGCIGTTMPSTASIASEIIQNAVSAGCEDPRFDPVSPNELDMLEYSVDVLQSPEPVHSLSELDPHQYGIIVKGHHRSGLLLPNLEGIDTVEQQLQIVLKKAGLSSSDAYSLERFMVERHR